MSLPLTTYFATLAASIYMTGIIWFVQLIHYPLFAQVPADRWPAYHETHMRMTAVVIAPAMLLELASAILLLWQAPQFVSPAVVYISLALVAVLWASTFLIQVPDHNRLAAGWDPVAIRRLVTTNRLRTIAWSLRSLLLLAPLLTHSRAT